MSSQSISRATEADIPELVRLTAACVAKMRSEGIEQWDEVYPAESDLRRDIAAQAVWVLREGGRIAGCLTFDDTLDPLWAEIPWQHTAAPIAAVHRVMVAPADQGRGLARKLMAFAEAEAKRQEFKTIRLDSFLQNPASMALYEKLGYTKAGTAKMRKGLFAGFEKSLMVPTEEWPKPEPRELSGRFFRLVPLDLDAHLDELFAISHSSPEAREIWRYLPWGPFVSIAEMRECLHGFKSQPGIIPLAVLHQATGRAVGSLSLINVRPEHGVAEIGFVWFGPAAQGTKANTEANSLLLRHCFEDLRYRRMEWKCNADNERSRRAAVRLGFRYEGTFRQHMAVKGRNRDTDWFAMLDFEWPRARGELERGLYGSESERWG